MTRIRMGMARAGFAAVLVLLVTVAVAALGIARLRLHEAREQRPDVILVTVDTLRADSLGCYGRADAGTPNFDRIAREGVLFENAIAPMPLTRPSHFSMMTSQLPRRHGVLNNSIALPETALTFPEVFREAGYHTIGVVSIRLLAPESGAAQGFDVFEAPSEPPRWSGREALERLTAQLRNRPDVKPVFVWLHLFEPHIPYVSHGEPKVEPSEISWPVLLESAARNQGAIPAAVFERARSLYQGEVAEVDRILGGVLELIEQTSRPSLLAIAADHGECFENGVFFEHADCLYEGAIRVPLLLRHPPELKPSRRRELVEPRRLAATLLSLAKIEVPASFERTSLFDADASPVFFETPFYTPGSSGGTAAALAARYAQIREVAGQALRPFDPATRQLGVRSRSWKLVSAGERDELFDLARDPRELANLAPSRPEVVADLRRLGEEWATRNPAVLPTAGVVTPEQDKLLRSLGYLR